MDIKRFVTLFMAILMVMSCTFAVAENTRPSIICHKAGEIVLDGKLDDWNLDSGAVVDQPTQVIRDYQYWETKGGAVGCSMTVYTAYDETNLYLAFDVTEDNPYGAIEMLPIDGEDNLKLYISTNPAADPERTTYGTNDFLVYMVMDEDYWSTAIDRSMIADKDTRARFVSVGMDGGENVIDGYTVGTELKAGGFIFECAIPWATFSNKKIPVYTPASGDVLSVNFVISDIDYPCPGTAYIPQMAWTGNQAINNNPSVWGSMTLE